MDFAFDARTEQLRAGLVDFMVSALGKAAVDSHSAHSQLGSGLSLPGGHAAAVRECGACWLVP